MTAVPPSGPAGAPIRWDISVLIGPCIQVEAEEAADHILQSLRGSNLGACVAMSPWSEYEPTAVPPSVQELGETVREAINYAVIGIDGRNWVRAGEAALDRLVEIAGERGERDNYAGYGEIMEGLEARAVEDAKELADALEACRGFALALTAKRDEARAQVAALTAAIEDYLLWEPRKAGHAAAHQRLRSALAGSPANTENNE